MIMLFCSLLALPLMTGQTELSDNFSPEMKPKLVSGEAYLACHSSKPTIREVQRASLKYAQLNPSRFPSWRRRVRHAPWLPKLLLRLNRGLSEDWRYATSGTSLDTDNNLHFEVRLRWDFDQLLFNRNEVYVHRESTRATQLRNELLRKVTRLFFKRRKLLTILCLHQGKDPLTRALTILRIEELTARLNAMTGGLYTSQIIRRPLR